MKKRFLISGAIILLLGVVVFVIGMTSLGWNFMKLDSEPWESKTFELEEIPDSGINGINISIRNAEIVFQPGATFKVEYDECDRVRYDIAFEEGALTMTENRRAADFFAMFQFHAQKIVVSLPGETAADMMKIEKINIGSTNGAITIVGNYAEVRVKTTNGALDLRDLRVDRKIDAETTNGALNLENIDMSEGALDIETTNGKVKAQNILADTIEFETTNGAVNVENVKAKKLSLDTTNGAIIASGVDVSTKGEFGTSNGAITLTLTGRQSDYRISSRTTHGSSPGNFGDGDIEIACKTTNGDITVRFAGLEFA